MLRRRSIRLRITVLVVVPVLALLGLYALVLNLTLGNLLTLKQEASIRQLVALPVASIQTQLGHERTLALQYVARPSHANLDALLGQEHKTDGAITSYRDAVQTALRSGPVPKERQAFLAWQTALGKINRLRAAVTTRGFTVDEAAVAYSALLDQGDNVLNQAITPVLTGPLGIQAVDVLTMAKAAQAVGEESDVVRADLVAHSFAPADLMLINQLVAQHDEEWSQTLPELDPNLQAYYRTIIPQGPAHQIAQMETLLTAGPPQAFKVPLRQWTAAEKSYQAGYLKTLLKCAATLAKEATAQAEGLAVNLILIAGFGLLAIVAAVGIGILLGRGLIRQLTDLKESAVDLSTRLPSAIMRVRSGEDVNVRTELPQLEPGSDEIGQVRQAFNMAARTAVAAAVDEANIRRGVNDVFRSLARRNQSLLTRQLQLLDAMERRVHDPEDLADLFRVDHLTTRMRRHAEGLLILAGGSSGRAWREPVPVVDVMRAAVAEVEDYTRIRVTSRTSAAVTGHAVADIIHLLAELVENAATFSPATTPVRIDGDKVARGVAIEIEDRGLGMGLAQLAAANALVQDPPMFDLSGSDQLGLFIAGQLAKRHDIKVSLRDSPYGGIIAVVLIPRSLTIDLDASQEPPAAITNIRQLGGRPVPQLPGPPSQPGQDEVASEMSPRGGFLVGADAHHRTATLAERVIEQPGPPSVSDPAIWPVPGNRRSDPLEPAVAVPVALDAGIAAATVPDPDAASAPVRRPAAAGLIWNEHGIGLADRTDVGRGDRADRADSTAPATDRGGPVTDEFSITLPAEMVDLDGLPMRVRQANLAPQLRRQPVVIQPEPADAEPALEPSPEAIRSTMAALQHGWERGRSESGLADELTPAPDPAPGPRSADDPSTKDRQEDLS